MTVKASELLPVVVQLAKDKPDTKARCKYFEPDATPCCIVGHGLAALGTEATPFLASSDLNQWTGVYELAVEGQIISDDEKAMDLLYMIQLKQDRGSTWGEALAIAEGINYKEEG